MKKLLTLFLALALILTLFGCGSTNEEQNTEQAEQEIVQAPDLSGNWTQANKNSETSYQTAVIENNTITIYWVDTETDTKALYWAGTFVAPTTADEPYTWDSENDTSQTSSAILASSDSTKTFTYQNEQISYDVTALGVTQTVKLEKDEQ